MKFQHPRKKLSVKMMNLVGSVYCNSLPVDEVDDCELAECDQNASCTDLYQTYSCQCNEGFSGDGFTCNEIILENECDLARVRTIKKRFLL